MMDDMNASDLIFIDETGATLNMTTNYARAAAGKRISMPAPANRGTNRQMKRLRASQSTFSV